MVFLLRLWVQHAEKSRLVTERVPGCEDRREERGRQLEAPAGGWVIVCSQYCYRRCFAPLYILERFASSKMKDKVGEPVSHT